MTPAQRLYLQSSLLAATHLFFQVRNVREVITPCMVSQACSEPDIRSFGVDSASYRLRSSPEYEMKRLLMTADADIYQIAPVFRKDEYGSRHRPEFIMLEWYRLGWDYRRLMGECLEYLQTLIARPDTNIRTLSYKQLFTDIFVCNPFDCSSENLSALATDLGYRCQSQNRAECLDFLFEHASSQYSRVDCSDTLVAIYDFPIEQVSFARISEHRTAERFEIFLNGIELANGYSELTDAVDYDKRVRLHNETRKDSVAAPISMDEDFMQALKQHGLAACAGVSVGIDRLLMCKARVEDIDRICLL